MTIRMLLPGDVIYSVGVDNYMLFSVFLVCYDISFLTYFILII